MNTANKLTMLRLALIPVFLVLLYQGTDVMRLLALAVFVIASLTDFVDGYIARHYNQITVFGKFMDPLADKILVLAAMMWFVEVGKMPAWCLLIVVTREFAVTAMRLVAVDSGRVIAAGWSGKVKTASTMIGICLILLQLAPWLDMICVVVIVATTVYSGAEYFVKNKDILNFKK